MRLSRLKEVAEYNHAQYVIIVRDFLKRILKQGCGCNVPGYGASYYNNFNKSFDPVGLVLGFEMIRKHYGLISAVEQKPLIKKLARKYAVNIETDKEYSNFVDFMQTLQDIHDFTFDEFYKVERDRMLVYKESMTQFASQIEKTGKISKD
jgi:hypothetical protein